MGVTGFAPIFHTCVASWLDHTPMAAHAGIEPTYSCLTSKRTNHSANVPSNLAGTLGLEPSAVWLTASRHHPDGPVPIKVAGGFLAGRGWRESTNVCFLPASVAPAGYNATLTGRALKIHQARDGGGLLAIEEHVDVSAMY